MKGKTGSQQTSVKRESQTGGKGQGRAGNKQSAKETRGEDKGKQR